MRWKEHLPRKTSDFISKSKRVCSHIECTSCGHSPQCTQCDVTLNLSSDTTTITLSLLWLSYSNAHQCHACGMPTLTTKGVGNPTNRRTVKQFFPEIHVGRMDWDSTRGKWGFDTNYDRFVQGRKFKFCRDPNGSKGIGF